jgi:hypothetical protein
MPAFAATLTPEDIAAVAAFVTSPFATEPDWSEGAIAATRAMTGSTPAAAPVFSGDPLNVTLVVDTGDHHVSVLDGDSF